jgi:hypothetical protein
LIQLFNTGTNTEYLYSRHFAHWMQ